MSTHTMQHELGSRVMGDLMAENLRHISLVTIINRFPAEPEEVKAKHAIGSCFMLADEPMNIYVFDGEHEGRYLCHNLEDEEEWGPYTPGMKNWGGEMWWVTPSTIAMWDEGEA